MPRQWRLLLAGIYPVEWRDFYLGDMFCSLTYSMSVSPPNPSLLQITDPPRASHCFSVSTRTVGTIPTNATRLTYALPAL